jgi:DNA-binding NtrC family response regulator
MTAAAPLRILYVDDDEEYALLFKLAVSRAGHLVTTHHSPHAALAALAAVAAPFDIMVTDFRMPGMDGLELIGQARSRVPDLRCALITSDLASVNAASAAAAGVGVTECKPERVEEFALFIGRAACHKSQ